MWEKGESFQNSNLLIISEFILIAFFCLFSIFFNQSQTISLVSYDDSVFNFFIKQNSLELFKIVCQLEARFFRTNERALYLSIRVSLRAGDDDYLMVYKVFVW